MTEDKPDALSSMPKNVFESDFDGTKELLGYDNFTRTKSL
jgi:hypothetical protein